MKQAIILGNGNSISEGIKKGLFKELNNHITFVINDGYLMYSSLGLFFSDSSFYNEHYLGLSEIPIIIGRKGGLISKQHTNTILISKPNSLAGVFALRVICDLGFDEIFLLGYDWGEINGKKRINKRNDETPMYKSNPDNIFKEFKDKTIWNVSLQSKILIFPRISYDEFFVKLNHSVIDKSEIIKSIKERLKNG